MQSQRGDEDQEPKLASRMRRLFAAMIDSSISSTFIIPIMMVLGVHHEFSASNGLSIATNAKIAATAYMVWFGLNAVPLHLRAQSLGKMMLGIMIVDEDSKPAPLLRIAVDRTLSIQIIALIPIVGAVIAAVDTLMIFRADRRCLHDHIARTRVIDRHAFIALQRTTQFFEKRRPPEPGPWTPQ
jgi:uncharacterized RDD family membrane protein YckC